MNYNRNDIARPRYVKPVGGSMEQTFFLPERQLSTEYLASYL